jgi:putative methionine-R-sulfoxide reductase with GAF domain
MKMPTLQPKSVRGVRGPNLELQVLLSFAYAVHTLRERQSHALQELAEKALAATGAQFAAIGALQQQSIKWLAMTGELDSQLAGRIQPAFGMNGAALQSVQVRIVTAAPDVPGEDFEFQERRVHSIAYIPASSGGKLVGVMAVVSKDPEGFGDHDLNLLGIFAKGVNQILRQKPDLPMPQELQEIVQTNALIPQSGALPAPPKILSPERTLSAQPTAMQPDLAMPRRGPLPAILTVAAVIALLMACIYPLRSTLRNIPAPPAISNAVPPAPQITREEVAPVAESAAAPATPAVVLNSVQVRRQGTRTFVIMNLSGDTRYVVKQLTKPERLVVELESTNLGTHYETSPAVRGALVGAVECFTTPAHQTKVTLRLQREAKFLVIGPNADHHLIIDLYSL